MKRKGFTLIELLAVIVVLAIIALIATPIVLNIINKAKEGAAEQSAVAYINAIENYMVLSLLNPDEYPLKLEKGKTYQISEDIYEIAYDTYSLIPVVYAEEETKDYVEGIYVGDYVYVNGTYPESGVITIGESGIIETATMSIGGYITECEQKKCEVIGKDKSDIIKVKEVKIADKSITELEVGETLELSATVKPDNATNKKISWLSSDPSIATVENGVVTANSAGKVIIQAVAGGKKDSIEISIVAFNDSLLGYVKYNQLTNDTIQNITVNGKIYSAHVYNFDGNQTWDEEKIFGDSSDVATETEYAKNMVIVKVNGDLKIGKSGIVRPYYTEYGGPKGFLLYVTGTLTNNGIIDNSHGAKAEGEDVYLWKNRDGSYEYVPSQGEAGGREVSIYGSLYNPGGWYYNISEGNNGKSSISNTRKTGGGGSGASVVSNQHTVTSGSGGSGTSYSGGTGGGGTFSAKNSVTGYSAIINGGIGGKAYTDEVSGYTTCSSGGAGNPGGAGYCSSGEFNQTQKSSYDGENGTGGLLIVYANTIDNSNGTLSATGHNSLNLSQDDGITGGASGGGSINLFYLSSIKDGNINVSGGTAATGYTLANGVKSTGGNGGNGSINIGRIEYGLYYPRVVSTEIEKKLFVGISYNIKDLLDYELSEQSIKNMYSSILSSDEKVIKVDDLTVMPLKEGKASLILSSKKNQDILKVITIEYPLADIYVSTEGNDENDGTLSNPVRTLSKAVSIAKSGDSIFIAPGEYELSSIYINQYTSVGVYDYGKELTIFGDNENTILRYHGSTSASRDGGGILLGNTNSIIRNLVYEYYPGKSVQYSNAIFSWNKGTVENVFIRVRGNTLASYIYFNDPSGTRMVKNTSFYFDKGSVSGNYSGSATFTNIATNVAVQSGGGTQTNVVVSGYGSAEITTKELIELSKNKLEFVSANAGVFYGTNAWK